jgi:hypothetical protein
MIFHRVEPSYETDYERIRSDPKLLPNFQTCNLIGPESVDIESVRDNVPASRPVPTVLVKAKSRNRIDDYRRGKARGQGVCSEHEA